MSSRVQPDVQPKTSLGRVVSDMSDLHYGRVADVLSMRDVHVRPRACSDQSTFYGISFRQDRSCTLDVSRLTDHSPCVTPHLSRQPLARLLGYVVPATPTWSADGGGGTLVFPEPHRISHEVYFIKPMTPSGTDSEVRSRGAQTQPSGSDSSRSAQPITDSH